MMILEVYEKYKGADAALENMKSLRRCLSVWKDCVLSELWVAVREAAAAAEEYHKKWTNKESEGWVATEPATVNWEERLKRLLIIVGDPGRCTSCHAYVYWVTMHSGRKMPVDMDGITHFATCPNAGRPTSNEAREHNTATEARPQLTCDEKAKADRLKEATLELWEAEMMLAAAKRKYDSALDDFIRGDSIVQPHPYEAESNRVRVRTADMTSDRPFIGNLKPYPPKDMETGRNTAPEA